MMFSRMNKALLTLSLLPMWAIASPTTADRIVAVVNENMITQTQLDQRMATLRVNRVNLPAQEVLNHLIDDVLLEQRAAQMGIQITPERVQQTLREILYRHHLDNLQQLQTAVEHEGVSWDEYLQNLRKELLLQSVHHAVAQQFVRITQEDINGFLQQYPTGLLPSQEKPQEVREAVFVPKAVHFQQIFIPLGEGASQTDRDKALQTLKRVYEELRQGKSFEAVARQYSAAPNAVQGGDMGTRLFGEWPQIFVRSTEKIPDGGVSEPIQAPNGFHVLKVVERRGIVEEKTQLVETEESKLAKRLKKHQAIMVNRYDVQTIRVSTNPVFTIEQAKQKIDKAYRALKSGESFEKLAQTYSDDDYASLGGAHGWIIENELSATSLAVIKKLKDGQYSKPFVYENNYYIVKRNGADQVDMSETVKRNFAYGNLYQQRAQAAVQDYMSQIRAGAYIENRLQ